MIIDVIMLQDAISKIRQEPTHAGERLNIHVEDYIGRYNMRCFDISNRAQCPEEIHFYEITLVAVQYITRHRKWLRWSIDI